MIFRILPPIPALKNLVLINNGQSLLLGFLVLELIIKPSHSLAGECKTACLSLLFGPVIFKYMNWCLVFFSRLLSSKHF